VTLFISAKNIEKKGNEREIGITKEHNEGLEFFFDEEKTNNN
jgi:hypothetical protein